MNFVCVTDVDNNRVLLRNNRQNSMKYGSISVDSTYIQTDKIKEFATARTNPIVTFIVYHKTETTQK